MQQHSLTNLLRLDAAANVLGGLGLLAAGGWLADPLGLGAGWPLWLVGVLFLVNGAENALVARRTTTGGLTGLIATDLGFALAVLGVVVADPTGAQPWARWAMAGLAALTAGVGIVKIVGLRSRSRAPRATSPVT